MVNKSPKFSLLMPTYNRADIISYAIESALNQTEKSFELLIVGDGCTDNTSQVVKKYLKDKRVKWFDFPKAPGFGYANRNKALRESKGKYIGFIAHDDILFPDHLEILAKQLEDKSVDIVYTRPLWVDPSGKIFPSPFNLENKEILKIFLNTTNGIPASCFAYRREYFKKVGYWNEKLLKNADWDLWKRIIKAGKNKKFKFDPRPTTFHFKAIWRTEENTYPVGLNTITPYIKQNSSILPDSLNIKIPKGKTEQEIFAKKIKDKKWINEIRRDSVALLDHMIQIQMPNVLEDIHSHQRWVQNLENQLKNRGFGVRSFIRKLLPRKR